MKKHYPVAREFGIPRQTSRNRTGTVLYLRSQTEAVLLRLQLLLAAWR